MDKAGGFLKIIVESDAKVCVDSLTCKAGVCPWNISALNAYSLELAVSFSTRVFGWVEREASQMAACSCQDCYLALSSFLLLQGHSSTLTL